MKKNKFLGLLLAVALGLGLGEVVLAPTKAQAQAIVSPCTVVVQTGGVNGCQTVSPTSPLPVGVSASTAGGASPYFNSALLATAVQIKGTAATLYNLTVFNTTASIAYVQIFNALATNVTVGTTVPTLSFEIPASGTYDLQGTGVGLAFSNGLTVAATTTATGSTAPGTGLVVNAGYK